MIAIGLTDHRMFVFWRDLHSALPEVNFWTPTPWRMRALSEGDHFYLLLKSPIRKIGGYGKFVRYEELRCSEAWVKYGPGNGVSDQLTLRNRAMGYVGRRTARDTSIPDPVIGCIILRDLVVLQEEQFFAPESRGAPVGLKVVKYKTFPEIDSLLPSIDAMPPTGSFDLVNPDERKDRKTLAVVRPDQQRFRRLLLGAYDGACTITGESTQVALDAAHIQPFVNRASNDVQNGLLLRKDIHALFDAGLLTVTSEMRVKSSDLLESPAYQELDGCLIRLPRSRSAWPADIALEFHRRWKFRA